MKNKFAVLIILLISIIYLHPIFLGKTDTPIDVRDVLMYPWRYHAVDTKIKKIVLWKAQFPSSVYYLKIFPGSISKAVFKISFNGLARESSDSNYYFSFDFKPVSESGSNFDFGLLLVNRITNGSFQPGFTITPLSSDKNDELSSWYKAYFNLNGLFRNKFSLEDLQDYDVVITAKNKSKSSAALLSLKDLQLICEGFSGIPKVHNYYINDLIQLFTPLREYFSSSIKKGKLPFWNNYIFSGTEFLAEPQVAYFHPVYFLSYLFFDHFAAHSLIVFVCFCLCGIGAYMLASYWGLSFEASLFTSIVYMFHPFNVAWFSYEHMLMNSATLPFLILFYEKNINHKRLLNKYLLISAFLLGLIFLSGHLQYIYYTVVFFFLFTCFRFFVNHFSLNKNHIKHIFSISFVLLFAMMIGLVVLIPFFPLFLNSHRVGNSERLVHATSFPLKAFLGLIYPYYGGHLEGAHSETSKMDPKYIAGFFNNYVYFGLLPLMFFIFSFKNIFSNKLTIFFVLSIIISFLISTGSPVFFLVKDILPGFKQMQHYRFLQLYSYSVPFLAGIGFQFFLNYISGIKKRLKIIIVSIVILVTIIDLAYYSSYFMTWSDKKNYKPLPKEGALKFLVDKQKKLPEPFRVLPFAIDRVGETQLKVNVAQPNTLLPYGLEEASGYSSFIPKDIYNLFIYVQTKDPNKLYTNEIINLFSNPNVPFPIFNFKSKILDLLNVKYFLVPSVITIEPQFAKKVFSGDCSIYENEGYLPRAFVVSDYNVIDSPKETILELDSEQFNPREKVVLMIEPEPLGPRSETQNLNSHLSSKVDFLKYSQDNIILKVNVNQPSFLVLGNNLNKNWKVKINDIESKHYQANLVQRAVWLPQAGNNVVKFYYYPRLFLIGLFMSCFAIITLILLALYLIYKKDELHG